MRVRVAVGLAVLVREGDGVEVGVRVPGLVVNVEVGVGVLGLEVYVAVGVGVFVGVPEMAVNVADGVGVFSSCAEMTSENVGEPFSIISNR